MSTDDGRAKTGNPELDAMLRGGFLRGDAVLLAGSAGTGKTVVSLQYLVKGAMNYGEGGLYVSFEQLPQQIYRDVRNFGWDLKKLEEENKVRVVCTSPDVLLRTADTGLLDGPIKETNAKRIVIDPISYLSMFVPEYEVRKEAYRFINYLKTKGLTSILTHEMPQVVGDSLLISDIGFSFLVDSVIMLRFVEIRSAVRRAIVVLKMRGSDHDKLLREYEITKDGLKISVPFDKYENILSGSPRATAEERFAKAFQQL